MTMHEDHSLSSWLRDSTEDKAEEIEKVNREAKEEECKHGKRECEGEKEKSGCVFSTRLL